MERQERNETEYYAIDLLHVMKFLWSRIWVIAVAGILAGAIGFAVSAFAIAPTYSSSIMLYVNNSSFSLGNSNFSISQLNAAQSLVKTYSVILDNRTTLERVIEKADLPYTYRQLSGMISSKQANETEIMKVTVTAQDPYEAAEIANTIAEVLPVRVSEIIDGATMEVVDSAIPVLQKVAPSITRYTAVSLILGVLVSALFLAVLAMLDDTIHDEEYILRTYDYPILGKVPDLVDGGNRKYGYGKKYGYYYARSKQGNQDGGEAE